MDHEQDGYDFADVMVLTEADPAGNATLGEALAAARVHPPAAVESVTRSAASTFRPGLKRADPAQAWATAGVLATAE
jgi:hypothetical protein